MEKNDNLLDVLKTIFSRKKYIIYVCAIAAIGSVIISLLLPVYYSATTIFYAASPDLLKPQNSFENIEMNYYGESEDIERILTIAKSNKLADFMIDSFNLYDHYKINTKNKKAHFIVKEEYFDLFNVIKTKYDAIELSFEDKTPELAAKMANTAREKLATIAKTLVKNSQLKLIRTYSDNFTFKEKELRLLSDSLEFLRKKYGIYNTPTQSELLAELIAKAETELVKSEIQLDYLKKKSFSNNDTIILLVSSIEGYKEEIASLNRKLNLFNEGMAIVDLITKQHRFASEKLSEDKEKYKDLLIAYNSNNPALFLVEKAEVPIVKSRPKRLIIVLGAIILAFIFTVISVLIFDTYKNVNWKEIINAK